MPEQARERTFSPAFESSGAPGTGPNLAAFEHGTDQTDFDVIVAGAGLSGIGVGYHLQRHCPRKSFVILEARGGIGGTCIIELAEEELGPRIDVERDFTPRYNPWDQRLCLMPDGDLFRTIREGKASVVEWSLPPRCVWPP